MFNEECIDCIVQAKAIHTEYWWQNIQFRDVIRGKWKRVWCASDIQVDNIHREYRIRPDIES